MQPLWSSRHTHYICPYDNFPSRIVYPYANISSRSVEVHMKCIVQLVNSRKLTLLGVPKMFLVSSTQKRKVNKTSEQLQKFSISLVNHEDWRLLIETFKKLHKFCQISVNNFRNLIIEVNFIFEIQGICQFWWLTDGIEKNSGVLLTNIN